MELTITNARIENEYDEVLETHKEFTDSLIDKVFESYEEMEVFQAKWDKEHDGLYLLFSFTESLSDEEEEAEWNDILRSTMNRAEATGIPFDHLMGMELAGLS